MPVYCGEKKKRSDGARKKKRRSTVVSAPQKIKPPLPYPINDREGFLLSTSSANERTVPGNTAVELHRLWCLCWFQCVRTMLICVSVSSAWSEYASAAPWVKETLVWGYLLLGQTGETGSYQYRWVLRCLLRVGRTKVQIVKIFFFFLPVTSISEPVLCFHSLCRRRHISVQGKQRFFFSLSETASSVTEAVLRARLSQRYLTSLHTSCVNVGGKSSENKWLRGN